MSHKLPFRFFNTHPIIDSNTIQLRDGRERSLWTRKQM